MVKSNNLLNIHFLNNFLMQIKNLKQLNEIKNKKILFNNLTPFFNFYRQISHTNQLFKKKP